MIYFLLISGSLAGLWLMDHLTERARQKREDAAALKRAVRDMIEGRR